MTKVPANFSVVGGVVVQPVTIEGDKIFFCIRFTINDCDDFGEGEVINSYFAVGTTFKEYAEVGALQTRLNMLDRARRELIGTLGPLSLERILEEFDYEIASFDWSTVKDDPLWHLEPLGSC